MASSMINICKHTFSKAKQVTDRFHVQKLANEAVQQLRIKHRWEALEKENKDMEEARAKGKTYTSNLLANGDTTKQLLARSRIFIIQTP